MRITKALLAVVACGMIVQACDQDTALQSPETPDASATDRATSLVEPRYDRASSPRIRSTLVPTSTSSEVLVFGDRTYERDQLEGVLATLGHAVTNVETLPADVSPYDVIWHVGSVVPLTSEEQTRLADFVTGGGGLHLTGERPCCESLNASLETLVNAVLVDGTVTVGGLGDFFERPFPFHPDGVGGITTTPNALDEWYPANPGGMAGVAPENLLVTHDATGTPNGAVWECGALVGGLGRLTILMDVDWLNPDFNLPASRDPEIQNVQTFLERSCANGVDVDIDIKPSESPNPVNLKGPQGVIPVAILGSAAFDVRDVDATTLVFGDLAEGESTRPEHDLTDFLVDGTHLQDVNEDGFDDLVSHYSTQSTGIDAGDTEACLRGATRSGATIEGCDAVWTIPPGS